VKTMSSDGEKKKKGKRRERGEKRRKEGGPSTPRPPEVLNQSPSYSTLRILWCAKSRGRGKEKDARRSAWNSVPIRRKARTRGEREKKINAITPATDPFPLEVDNERRRGEGKKKRRDDLSHLEFAMHVKGKKKKGEKRDRLLVSPPVDESIRGEEGGEEGEKSL